jgi:hypothetical protein
MLVLLMALSCVLSMQRSSVATSRIEGSRLNPPPNVNHRDTQIAEILSVLEDKVGNREVAEKLKDKVFTLSNKQTRLIASLARLTANGDQAAGAEIVFLVITILIIVS